MTSTLDVAPAPILSHVYYIQLLQVYYSRRRERIGALISEALITDGHYGGLDQQIFSDLRREEHFGCLPRETSLSAVSSPVFALQRGDHSSTSTCVPRKGAALHLGSSTSHMVRLGHSISPHGGRAGTDSSTWRIWCDLRKREGGCSAFGEQPFFSLNAAIVPPNVFDPDTLWGGHDDTQH